MTEEMGGKICVPHVTCEAQIFKKKARLRNLVFFWFFLGCFGGGFLETSLKIASAYLPHKAPSLL